MPAMKQLRSVRSILASCAAVAVAALAAGCGGDDDEDAATPEAAKPVSLAITATSEGDAKAMTFASSIKAGLVNMTLKNADTVPRSAQLLRIVGDHSITDVVKVVTGDGEEIPSWVQDGGGVPVVAPGASATASQVLAPGRYVLLDDEEGEGDDAKSYAELGAARELTITGERSKARLPARSATITAEDAVEGRKHTYGFRLEGLKAGTNQVHFQNTGLELHHALFVPLRRGATIAQAEKYFSADRQPSGPPPVEFAKLVGTKVIDAGIEQNVTLDLEAGRYAVICFISDREGGRPHVAKGMIEELRVG
jgi:hypothetical protein